MVRVRIRELKNRLSYYLRMVRSGETVIVLDRDRTIAEIRPRGDEPDRDPVRRYLDQLVEEGLLIPAGSHPGAKATEIALHAAAVKPPRGWREAYAFEREDRFE